MKLCKNIAQIPVQRTLMMDIPEPERSPHDRIVATAINKGIQFISLMSSHQICYLGTPR